MKKSLFTTFFLSLFLLGGCDLNTLPSENNPLATSSLTACTEEAKICPDGSTVSRTGANCEFAPCPSSLVEKENCTKIGEKPSTIDLQTGKKVIPQKPCCEGLTEISEYTVPDGAKICKQVQGGLTICAPCGDGNCDAKYGENRCNCFEDCK